MSSDYVYVRRQTAIQSGVGKSELAFTGKWEVVQSKKGWGQVGEVLGVVDDKDTAFNMCKLINGGVEDKQVEEINWNGARI